MHDSSLGPRGPWIKKKLEELTGDDRLDPSALKGNPEVVDGVLTFPVRETAPAAEENYVKLYAKPTADPEVIGVYVKTPDGNVIQIEEGGAGGTVDLSDPGPIGDETPSTGAFTAITLNSIAVLPSIDEDSFASDLATRVPTQQSVKAYVTAGLAGKANTSHTQAASTITDFDTEVSNNTDVAANTAARHTHANAGVLSATTASFLIADETKLDGIEALADVTDSINVDAAGAVMNSDASTTAMQFVIDEDSFASDLATKVPTQQSVKTYVDSGLAGKANSSHTQSSATITDFSTAVTNHSDVFANTAARHTHSNIGVLNSTTASFLIADETKLDGIATGATANATDAQLRDRSTHTGTQSADTLTDGTTNKAFLATERTKLAAIEALADVTDAANVDAAGAVMNTDTSTASMQFVVDEDDMTSNSAIKVPTQQSVKAYVDDAIADSSSAYTIKTANYTAVSGDKIAVDVTGGGITITLPASPANGDIVDIVSVRGVIDIGGNFLTIERNGNNIDGAASTKYITLNQGVKFVYESTYGWTSYMAFRNANWAYDAPYNGFLISSTNATYQTSFRLKQSSSQVAVNMTIDGTISNVPGWVNAPLAMDGYSSSGPVFQVKSHGVNTVQFYKGGGVGLITQVAAFDPTTDEAGFFAKNVGDTTEVFIVNEDGVEVQLSGCHQTIEVTDRTSDLTTGDAKYTFFMPYAMKLTSVRATVTTAPVGSNIIVDVNKNGTTVLSTKVTIEDGERTSVTATTQPVVSVPTIADNDVITFDIDQVGSSTAGKHLVVRLYGTRA